MSRRDISRIVGRRYDLVDVSPEYFESIVRWRNEPENMRCFLSRSPSSLATQTDWFARYLADPTDMTFVILARDGRPVGMVALYHVDEVRRTAEFGRLLVGEKAYRGKGAGREATRLCLDLAFKRLELAEVHLAVFEWNTAAIRLYRRFGFEMAGSSLLAATGGLQERVLRMALRREMAVLESIDVDPSERLRKS